MDNLSRCCQAEKRYSTGGCPLCWTCTKCGQFGGCDNYANRISLSAELFYNVSMESKVMLESENIVEPIAPELSHGSDIPINPPPPIDDDGDDDEDGDFFDDDNIELQFVKEGNRQKNIQQKLNIEAFRAQTARLSLLKRMQDSTFTGRCLYNPKLAILQESELGLSPTVKQQRDAYYATLYSETTKELTRRIPIFTNDEDNNGQTN